MSAIQTIRVQVNHSGVWGLTHKQSTAFWPRYAEALQSRLKAEYPDADVEVTYDNAPTIRKFRSRIQAIGASSEDELDATDRIEYLGEQLFDELHKTVTSRNDGETPNWASRDTATGAIESVRVVIHYEGIWGWPREVTEVFWTRYIEELQSALEAEYPDADVEVIYGAPRFDSPRRPITVIGSSSEEEWAAKDNIDAICNRLFVELIRNGSIFWLDL